MASLRQRIPVNWVNDGFVTPLRLVLRTNALSRLARSRAGPAQRDGDRPTDSAPWRDHWRDTALEANHPGRTAKAKAIAADLGIALPKQHRGGGSDGNFTAAMGIPTLDGLGCPGGGAHASDEHIEWRNLAPRAQLLAGLLESAA